MRELRNIICAHYCPHVTVQGRKFSLSALLIYGALPLGVGMALCGQLGQPKETYLALLIAVYGVLAAVLVGLLPIVYSIADNTFTRHSEGQYPSVQRERRRLQVLQDLYATISYGTILLVLAVGALIAFVFVPGPLAGGPDGMLVSVLLTIVYAVGCSTVLSVFRVATGVFTAMEDQVERVKVLLDEAERAPPVE